MRKFKISPEAQEKLLQYPFPGNIRELKSIMELAAVMAEEQEIRSSGHQLQQHHPHGVVPLSGNDHAGIYVPHHQTLP